MNHEGDMVVDTAVDVSGRAVLLSDFAAYRKLADLARRGAVGVMFLNAALDLCDGGRDLGEIHALLAGRGFSLPPPQRWPLSCPTTEHWSPAALCGRWCRVKADQ